MDTKNDLINKKISYTAKLMEKNNGLISLLINEDICQYCQKDENEIFHIIMYDKNQTNKFLHNWMCVKCLKILKISQYLKNRKIINMIESAIDY